MTNYILWGITTDPTTGKELKVPIDFKTGRTVDAHDSRYWTSRAVAEAALPYQKSACGIGMAISENDPYFFIDIDHGLDPETGTWRPDVQQVIDRFPGAYTEVSYSGDGFHIIGRYTGELPGPRWVHARKPDVSFDLLAVDKRYVALTGRDASGSMDQDLTVPLTAFITERLLKQVIEERPVTSVTTDDTVILEKALQSKSAGSIFGSKATFAELWNAKPTLKKFFPDKHGLDKYDASEVDMALAQHLAFWCGRDQEQIRRLMEQSKLNREKWTLRPEYLSNTISYACSRQETVYRGTTVPPADSPGAADSLRTGLQYLTPIQQLELFKGCVYVREIHRVLLPDGALIKSDQFKAHFGGYIFALDSINDKTTTDAWKAFTENQAYRCQRAIGTKFNPLKDFGEIINGYVNVYRPYEPDAREGDITPFLNHMNNLLPNHSDQEILLSYMAACVQHKGVKFQWCPVIQGVEGNGKTALYSILEYALGENYCHLQDPEDIKNTFNSWIENKLLIGIEEIHTGGRYEIANRLKTLITNQRVSVQSKGVDQRTGDNIANFMLFSNYKDAVLKTESDRRYAVFYTAQQEPDDLKRYGMDNKYFNSLYTWLRREGNAYVTQYLMDREITVELTGRAPETGSTSEAIEESRSIAEKLVLDAVETGEEGFTSDYIRLEYVGAYLRRFNKLATPNQITNLLKKIGYGRKLRIQNSGNRVTFYVSNESVFASESDSTVRNILLKYIS